MSGLANSEVSKMPRSSLAVSKTVKPKKEKDGEGKKEKDKEKAGEAQEEAWWPQFVFDSKNCLKSKLCLNLRNS